MAVTSCGQGVPLFGSLLVREEDEEAERCLEARELLLQRAMEAAGHFLCRKGDAFDPSVGDQACQIRALRFSLLFREKRDDEIVAMQKSCMVAIEKIKEIRAKFLALKTEEEDAVNVIREVDLKPLVEKNDRVAREKEAALQGVEREQYQTVLQPFVKRFKEIALQKAPFEARIAELGSRYKAQKRALLGELEFAVSEVALEAIQAYILTITREHRFERALLGDFQYHEDIKIRKLESLGLPFPSKLMDRVVETAKRGLAASSILFARRLAGELQTGDALLLQRMVSGLRTNPKRKQEELPFYYMTEAIFKRAAELNVPVVLEIRNIQQHPLEDSSYVCRLLFVGKGGRYELAPRQEGSDGVLQEAIVIKAFSRKASPDLQDPSFQRMMLEAAGGLERLIGLNAVQHTQYTDQTPKTAKTFEAIAGISPEEVLRLEALKREAIEKGFSNENPALCCIDHIYCGLLNLKHIGCSV